MLRPRNTINCRRGRRQSALSRSVVLLATLIGTCWLLRSTTEAAAAFTTPRSSTSTRTSSTPSKSLRPSSSSPSLLRRRPRVTALNAVDPNSFADQASLEALSMAASAVWDSTSHFLADAASAAAVAASDDGGWWKAYLNIFKNALSLVHDVISPPLKSAGVENTWGISIFVFTALIRSALIPLSIQQSKSAEYMKALKPYMSDIRERFKDNQDAQNRAIAKLYEDANQNPLAGCLVSLAQLPVFLGLYRGVRLLAMDGELGESFLWIPSLEGPVSAPDFRGLDWLTSGWSPAPVDAGGFPYVPMLGWETTLAFLVMPVVLVLLQSVTMSALQPPIDDNTSDEERETLERTQGILKFLPLLIGFFSLQVPAGLTIYWFASNIFTLTQSLGVRAYYAANPPQIELPEYWDSALSKDADFDSMSPEDRRKASEAGIRVGPSFEDLKDEARFHCLVERKPMRLDGVAAQLQQQQQQSQKQNEGDEDSVALASASIAAELLDWVQSGPDVTKSSSSSVEEIKTKTTKSEPAVVAATAETANV